MKDYLETFAEWYPQYLGHVNYPVYTSRVYSVKKRDELYGKLTLEQKNLIDGHRRYKIRSLFLKNNYMRETEWEFETIRINFDFNSKNTALHEKLKCKCGRPLKYQFIIRSKKTKKMIKLGISHFSDHLNIPLDVAREIQKGVNNVDIAMDQLLELVDRQIPFPENLWQRYCYAFYRNNQLREPVSLNTKLAKRTFDFRKAKMPIYVSDYQELEKEIRKVSRQSLQLTEDNFYREKVVYEKFVEDFILDLDGNNLFNPECFLAKNAKKLSERNSSKIRKNYFHSVFNELRSLSSDSFKAERKWGQFSKSFHVNQVDPIINQLIFDMYQKHKFSPNFFLGLPRLIRNGLIKERNEYLQTQQKQNKVIELERKKELEIKKKQQREQLEIYINNLPESFFETFADLLKIKSVENRKVMIRYFISDYHGLNSILEKIMQITDEFCEIYNFQEIFQEISLTFSNRLASYHSNEKVNFGLKKVDNYNFEGIHYFGNYLHEVWRNIPKEYQKDSLTFFCQLAKEKNDFLAEASTALKLPDSDEFYMSIIKVLKNEDKKSEDILCEEIEFIFERFEVSDWELAFTLLESSYEYKSGNSFEEAFNKIPTEFRKRLMLFKNQMIISDL
ncbi:hypothetical protein [Enterococcus massiliensis]|uniref:hypothetical protein n=1 Tax=Enterococcus massiliensis TaxID=1640685 RepID=UPI00065E8BCF|nr:hypothetical protein [Enterococcus massiliensis]